MEVVKFKKTHPDAKIPTKSYEEAAGLDLYSVESANIPPGEHRTVNVGLQIELPSGYCAMMFTRSGYGFSGLRNHQGLIDSDYTGDVSPCMFNHTQNPVWVGKGERVGQLFIVPVVDVRAVETVELKRTERGEKGFGSSGK